MDFVSRGKNTLLLYVTVCEKVVPRLNKHDDVMECNFMKSAPRNDDLVSPLPATLALPIFREHSGHVAEPS